ncbi:hypothetical protein CXG81DRAFT_23329 [Caulochytrium protostelioides]|uniref:PH domain-containing protein n=1 Tax=Caulochytrium protostelioides TaxID=1555241 RepID=A0A4P9XEW6_9FUNG|nr:hypothetical protein CXG81DRAFT_23329 [Caulochytrium protostelioides]|eukprot:RKP04072.1 hypothetical protein CXG81DRAFT_23329 [Caulochytrium protostelioides]
MSSEAAVNAPVAAEAVALPTVSPVTATDAAAAPATVAHTTLQPASASEAAAVIAAEPAAAAVAPERPSSAAVKEAAADAPADAEAAPTTVEVQPVHRGYLTKTGLMGLTALKQRRYYTVGGMHGLPMASMEHFYQRKMQLESNEEAFAKRNHALHADMAAAAISARYFLIAYKSQPENDEAHVHNLLNLFSLVAADAHGYHLHLKFNDTTDPAHEKRMTFVAPSAEEAKGWAVGLMAAKAALPGDMAAVEASDAFKTHMGLITQRHTAAASSETPKAADADAAPNADATPAAAAADVEVTEIETPAVAAAHAPAADAAKTADAALKKNRFLTFTRAMTKSATSLAMPASPSTEAAAASDAPAAASSSDAVAVVAETTVTEAAVVTVAADAEAEVPSAEAPGVKALKDDAHAKKRHSFFSFARSSKKTPSTSPAAEEVTEPTATEASVAAVVQTTETVAVVADMVPAPAPAVEAVEAVEATSALAEKAPEPEAAAAVAVVETVTEVAVVAETHPEVESAAPTEPKSDVAADADADADAGAHAEAKRSTSPKVPLFDALFRRKTARKPVTPVVEDVHVDASAASRDVEAVMDVAAADETVVVDTEVEAVAKDAETKPAEPRGRSMTVTRRLTMLVTRSRGRASSRPGDDVEAVSDAVADANADADAVSDAEAPPADIVTPMGVVAPAPKTGLMAKIRRAASPRGRREPSVPDVAADAAPEAAPISPAAEEAAVKETPVAADVSAKAERRRTLMFPFFGKKAPMPSASASSVEETTETAVVPPLEAAKPTSPVAPIAPVEPVPEAPKEVASTA